LTDIVTRAFGIEEWLRKNADGLGRRCVSELARNFRGQI
jgi:hypothetical protein